MKSHTTQNPLIKFLSSNNLFAFAIVFAALVPVYSQRAQDNSRIESIEVQASETAEQIEAAAQDNAVSDADIVADKIELGRQSVAESEAAKKAIRDRRFELESGYCSRFVRQVVEKTHGKKYSYLFGASAKISAQNFLDSPYGYQWPRDQKRLKYIIQVGDILFKTKGSGGYGHVGIYVGKINGVPTVAENSSTSIGRVQGAKGFRSLAQYGAFDVLGRLPLPANYKK